MSARLPGRVGRWRGRSGGVRRTRWGPITGRQRVCREERAAYGAEVPLTTAQVARGKAVSRSVVLRAVGRGELAGRYAESGRRRLEFDARDVDAWTPPCMRPPPRRHRDDDLLAALRLAADRLGRAPSQNDLVRLRVGPSVATLRRRFGAYGAALERADLAPTPRRPAPGRPRSRLALLAMLRDLESRLGRPPTCADALRSPGFPPPSTFARRFGSWRAAVAAARSDDRRVADP